MVPHDNDSSVVVIVEERRASEESVVVVDEEDVSTSERTQLLEPEPEPEPEPEDRPSTSEIAPGEHDLEASASETSPTAPAPSRKTGLFGFFNRYLGGGGSSASSAEDPSGASDDIERQASSSVSSNPVCLICLEPLSQADFASGEAIHLDCGCRGDLAVRHRECAVKWSQVKDDGRGGLPQCELCKKPVKNLPELPRRPSREREREREQAGANVPVMTIEELMQGGGDQFDQFEQFVPSRADLAFDCVRVMWIAMIVSILFFDADMSLALITGMVAGIAYLTMLRVLYKQQYQALRAYAEAQRDASAAAFPRMVIRV